MENTNKNTISSLIENLNAKTSAKRLASLKELLKLYDSGELERPIQGDNVNNHIHTNYSFSPYSPTMAVYKAWLSGLATAGIMDHDSVGGLEEFIEAGRILGIAVTVGFELRCDFSDTPLAGKRINNPDQNSVAYLAMHGIPHDKIGEAEAFLKPYREKRNVRNRLMIEKLNELTESAGLFLDFEKDVLPLSEIEDGGAVTERLILFALAGKILEKVDIGPKLVAFLKEKFNIQASGSVLEKLNDPNEEWVQYYLLGLLKSYLVESFYIDATDELPSYKDFVRLGESLGAISAYAYLGDVGDSVTGDKRTQEFEDAFLDELVEFLKNEGFRAVTFMPTRNTALQGERIMKLCEKYQLFQICGEDINSPFQSFICQALEKPEYQHLITAAWALIGHENSADGMFKKGTPWEKLPIEERVEYFANIGRNLNQ